MKVKGAGDLTHTIIGCIVVLVLSTALFLLLSLAIHFVVFELARALLRFWPMLIENQSCRGSPKHSDELKVRDNLRRYDLLVHSD